MITEPELVGGPDEGPGPELLDTEEGPTLAERARVWRKLPWVWAVGGAVVASALWAGGLYVFRDQGPNQRGYVLKYGDCGDLRVPELSRVFGERNPPADAASFHDDPALVSMECTLGLRPRAGVRPGDTVVDVVTLTVEQHRRTDPGPEFAVRSKRAAVYAPGLGDELPLGEVRGLGDRAYYGSGAVDGFAWSQLSVLDGGVVLSLSVQPTVQRPEGADNGPSGEPDLSGVREKVLVADMRSLMEQLKK
ncbi:hypothetical protein GCM10010329_02770 [Streptomyces spiroverticillatus]|uniref:Uncharacterized protein n=1 Tax=Streptomyces finlayi TaxID=67296 RepID=A0A919C6Z2_9ACTN|nr:hypothetical protein [Streptomyces finlayi]GGZ86392.1 hypothetical protein GCM10010329_02770 [Streptomyces spiroverticillatus]GHC77930.1 hypothetical protein GCM10010334_02750 [Streptomyces finlayi]